MIAHLTEIPGRVVALNLRCHCGEHASVFVRCRNRHVVARCASHGHNMMRERDSCGECRS